MKRPPLDLDLDRLGADYRAHLDEVMAKHPATPWSAIGIIMRKPFGVRDIDRLNDLLDERNRRDLTLDVYETEKCVSILAYPPVRRLGRQEMQS